eukprot:m.177031 g.177031  ORF g.177031 m.177031 type:complete len:444 (-) comp9967_c0_seq1:321-1652(-)
MASSARASVLANLQECQRNLANLRAQHSGSRRSLEEVEGSIRALEAKTARSEREESRLDKAYDARTTLAATVEGLRVAIERKEADEADLKRALQTLPPGEMFQPALLHCDNAEEDVVTVLFACADPSPSTPSVSVLMARNVSKQEFEAKFFEKAPDIIAGTVSFERAGLLIATDDDVQSMMRDLKTASIEVIYDTGRKAYSSWTEDQVRAKRILDDGQPFPDYGAADLPPIAVAQQEALREELERCANKLGRPKAGSALLEAVRRVFIDVFMLRVVECFAGVFLAMDLSLVGSLGNGKLDYIIHYLRNWIVVTEAKKDDFSKGIAQNIIEMRSAAEDSRRKRKKWLPVYGIVSDGNIWVFLCLHEDGRTYSRSKDLGVTYTATAGDPSKTTVQGADVVFKHLYKIVEAQVTLLQEEEGKQPAVKRQRLDLNPDSAVAALDSEP